MLIKEIITFAFGIIGTLIILHGPLHLKQEMRNFEIQILQETARTNNWGNPSIFAGHHYEVHAVTRLSPVPTVYK